MSKYLKKISVLATIILLSAQSTTFAVTTKTSNAELYKGTAEQLIKEMKSDKIIENSIPLYNTKNVESSVLFDLNGGYVIIDEATNEVSEFNLTEDNPIINDNSKHYVYGGPENIYLEKDNKLENLQTKEKENNKDAIENDINAFRKNVQANKLKQNLSSVKTATEPKLYGEMIGGKIPNFEYNPNGICGSCASANFLAFFCWNVNSRFVPQKYQASINSADNGVQLIKSIVPYVELNGAAALDPKQKGGSTAISLRDGLTKYLKDEVGYIGPTYLLDGRTDPSQSIAVIKRGIPFILRLHPMPDNSNPYKNHWVLGVGYVYMESNPNMPLYYRVVNGWGQNDAYVNFGWTDFLFHI